MIRPALVVMLATAFGLSAVAQTVPPVPTPPPVAVPPAVPGGIEPLPAAPTLLPAEGPVVLDVAPDANSRALYDHSLQTIRWGTPLSYRPIAGPSILDPLLPADPFAGWRWPNSVLEHPIAPGTRVRMEGLARGMYYNDQRIQWTGVEASFGGEAVLRPSVRSEAGGWVVSSEAELFINQPYNNTILRSNEVLLYRDNFRSDPFQVFQLFVQAEYGDWAVRVGRSRTPFGRYQSPMFTNRMADAPVLRTDVIGFTETGVFAHYRAPTGGLVIDGAVVNGEPDLDTNSSKALVGRVGYEGTFWTAGLSGKIHDGISSEQQKRYNNAAGVDASVRLGRVLVYGEGVYDEHGLHRDFDTLGIPPLTGPRSLYGRDVYPGSDKRPIGGLSYHIGAAYRGDRLTVDLNYGSYTPQKIGIVGHDEPVHRTVLKGAYSITPNLQVFAVGLYEPQRPIIGVPAVRTVHDTWAVFTGVQVGF